MDFNKHKNVKFAKMFVLNFFCVLCVASVWAELPEEYHSYYDPKGAGLYGKFETITSLNSDTFDAAVYSNKTSWLIEFYNSWCGDCLRFSPHWKKFSLYTKNWKSVVRIGGVDCTNPRNTKLCREYEIKFFPTLRYFPKYSSKFLGTPIENMTMDYMRHILIDKLREENNLPYLHIQNKSLSQIWKETNASYILASVDDLPSYTGAELVIDLYDIPSIQVVLVNPANQDFKNFIPPAFVLFEENGKTVNLPRVQKDDLLHDLHYLLVSNTTLIPLPVNYSNYDFGLIEPEKVQETLEFQMGIKQRLGSKKFEATVFRVDIENALRQSLFIEIPSKNEISGEMLHALQKYLEVLSKYFPIGNQGVEFLKCVRDEIKDKRKYSGDKFFARVNKCSDTIEPIFLEYNSDNKWIGCRGSDTFFRGYPCSLWTMFHTLTIQAHVKKGPVDEVLNGMTGYIKHFFGCSFCARHFAKMAITFPGNVTTTEDSVLWLWKAHNSVNKRLYNDETQDPLHVKQQFPPKDVCEKCSSENGVFDEDQVLKFLTKMYTDISDIRGNSTKS